MVNLVKAVDEIYNTSTYPLEDSFVLEKIFRMYKETERKEYTSKNHKETAVFMEDKGPSEITAFVQFSTIRGKVMLEKAVAGEKREMYQFFKDYSF